MRRLAVHWLLAVALVVAQHGIFAHALSHLGQAAQGHDGGPPAGHPPGVCLAFVAASGGALPSSDLPLAAEPAPNGCVAAVPTDPLLPPVALSRFASRAPPFPV
jgi:hypothetical protein